MTRVWEFLGSLALLTAPCDAKKDRALVIIESEQVEHSHTYLINNLMSQFDCKFQMADDPELQFVKYGIKMYQHLFVMAPSTDEFGGDVKAKTFSEFVDLGGNLVVVGSPNIGDAIRTLGAEFGIEYDEAGTKVLSNYEPDYEDNCLNGDCQNSRFLLRASDSFLGQSEPIVGTSEYGGLLVSEAIAMKIDDANTMAFPIMRCNKFCYSWFPHEKITEYPLAIGNDITLMAGIQFRNNARAVFMSSMHFLSNDIQQNAHIVTWKRQEKDGRVGGKTERMQSSNQKLLQHVLGWVSQFSGRLRVVSLKHKLKEGKRNQFYYIKETIKVQVHMEIWQQDSWEPLPVEFPHSVWLEFHRLDPFIRTRLFNEGGGKLTAEFDVPDTYGVFNFIVKFNKLGFTKIESKSQVTVRPLRHDMYERFIQCAFPYYFSAFSMMFGVLLLSFAFLYHKDEKTKTE